MGKASHISQFIPEFKEEQSNLFIASSATEKAKEIILDADLRLDVYALEQEFLQHAQESGFEPDNVNGAFVGFVRRKTLGNTLCNTTNTIP